MLPTNLYNLLFGCSHTTLPANPRTSRVDVISVVCVGKKREEEQNHKTQPSAHNCCKGREGRRRLHVEMERGWTVVVTSIVL